MRQLEDLVVIVIQIPRNKDVCDIFPLYSIIHYSGDPDN